MNAIRMNMKKVLAVFLTVCMLLSYNPAFGAVDAAFADDNTSTAKTEIDITTFDSTLEVNSRDPFSATVDDLRTDKVDGVIWFEVTGGMPSTGAGVDPYNVEYKVFCDGKPDDALTAWLTNPANKATEWKYENEVATYHVDLNKVAKAGLLEDDHHYTFTASFVDSEGNDVTRQIDVYTTKNGVVDYAPDLIKGTGELEGVEAEGEFQQKPKTELTGGKLPEGDPVKEAMENQAAKDTVEGKGDDDPGSGTGDDDPNYVIGDVLHIGTNPEVIPDTGEPGIPPFKYEDLTLRLPIDEDYVYDEDDNPNGYKPGDKIPVLWSGDDTGKVQPVIGEVVVGDDGKLKAEIKYPYWKDEDGDGVDDTGWPPLPGNFAIEYDTNRLPDSEQPGMEAEYFSITTKVVGSGTVSPSEERYWRVKKGADITDVLEQASYAFSPMSVGTTAYELVGLTLRQVGGSKTYDFINNASAASAAGSLNALKTTLTLTNDGSVFTKDSKWELSAVFGVSTLPPNPGNKTHKLTVKALNDGSTSSSSWGGVYVVYTDVNENLQLSPENGQPTSTVSMDMLNGTEATIMMVPAGPVDGKYHKVKGIQLRSYNEGATPGEFEVQRLEQPFIVPATDQNVEVNVIFEETTSGGGGGGGDVSGSTYTAEASVMTPDMGFLIGSSKVEFGASSAVVPDLRFLGKTPDYYLDYVDVFIEGRDDPERIYVNERKLSDYTLNLPNYHANVRVEAYFADAGTPTIELTMKVITRDLDGNETESITGGNIVPLDWEPTDMVRSGQRCTLLLSANDNYDLAGLTEVRGTQAFNRIGDVVGGVWAFVPMDERADTSTPLPITVTATFEQRTDGTGGGSGSGDPVGPGDPNNPGDNNGKASLVNVYVADKGLKQSGAADLDYIFNPVAGKFNSNVLEEDTNLNAFKAAIAVDNYAANQGQVNGQSTLLGTVDYGADFALNLVGNTVDSKEYGIQKLLLVEYYYTTDSATGAQKKQPLKWSLYHTNIPLYVLQNVTTNTDAIAYFAPIGDGTGGTTGDGGFTENSYVDVTVSATPAAAANLVSPSGTIKVVKGGLLPIQFTTKTSDFELNQAQVITAAETTNITSEVVAAANGSSLATYTLENITTGTTVTADYGTRSDDDKPSWMLDAELYVKDGDSVGVAGSEKPGRVRVGSGPNFAQSNILTVGAGNGIEFKEGSDLRVTMERDEGRYALADLSFQWNDGSVYAYYGPVKQADGSVRNVIRFTNSVAELSGKQAYTSGTSLYASSAPANTTNEVWYVQNLLCPVTVAPVYQKSDGSGGGGGGGTETPIKPGSPEDAWTIITKVGTGHGQVLTDSPNFGGCITKVAKRNPDNLPLTISFVAEEGYKVSDVHVSTSTGNPVTDFWTMVTGFITHLGKPDPSTAMKNEAMENGYIQLAKVNSDYEIVVDFAVDDGSGNGGGGGNEGPGGPGTPGGPGDGDDDDDPLKDRATVNVMYDPEKGLVVPNTGLIVGKDSEQQFVVYPNEVDGKYYTVVGVKVGIGDDDPTEVRAIDPNSPLVKWGDPFNNTFVVDFSQLDWPDDGTDPAVTIEVVFSDTPNGDGNGGNGGGGGDEGDEKPAPGTPSEKDMKQVTVNVVTDGTPVPGQSNIGGVVAPRGLISLVPNNGAAAGSNYKQRVYVSPAEDYKLDKIAVVSSTQSGTTLASQYTASVNEKKYFEVEANAPGTETITVYFKTKPLNERSYSINVEANFADADRFILPHGWVTIANNASQSYTIDPDPNYQVARIKDVGIDANGNEVAIKGGATWERGDSTEAKSSFTVSPVKVGGKVVDRQVTVEFEYKEGVDHSIGGTTERVNIHVMGVGSGAEYLTFTPSENMTDVLKGSKNHPMSYHYRFSLSEQAVKDGYAIYWIQNNGTNWFGAVDNTTNLKTEDDFTFTTDNMTRTTNTLLVYVKQFATTPGGPGTNPGDDPNKPGPDDPNKPGDDKFVTIDYGSNNGGTVTDKEGEPQRSNTTTRHTLLADVPSGGETNNTITAVAGEPFTLLMTPDKGNVLAEVYLHNCFVLSYNWVAPDDDRTAKVALEYTMLVSDEEQPARVFALFAEGDDDTFKGWDDTHVDDRGSYTTDTKLKVEIGPGDSVAALVDALEDGTPKAGDLFQMTNPVAPFSPQVVSKKGANDEVEGYSLTFDTISKISDPNDVRILVGPLIKWNEEDNAKSKLFTIDSVTGFKDGFQIVEQPLKKETADGGETEAKIVNGAEGEDGDGAATTEEKPKYYTYYELRGALPDDALQSGNDEHVVHVGLRGLSLADGQFPDYMSGNGGGNGGNGDNNGPGNNGDNNGPGNNGDNNGDNNGPGNNGDNNGDNNGPGNNGDNNGDNNGGDGNNGDNNGGDGNNNGDDQNNKPVPAGKVRLQIRVASGEGTIVPTNTTAVAASWFDGNLTGPWDVAQNSTVAFKVEPADNFVLNTLVYNGTNALANGSFNADTNTLSFRATASTTVAASFVAKSSPDAMRTVTIEVQDGHGTTSPDPGTHSVEKGKPYPITFKADSGYVPYRIWIDGVESYVSPSLSGWMIPAAWSDQTFKVQYAKAGTTPSTGNYLVQTGQNAVNDAATGLVRTGDNPWLPVIVLLLLVAGGAAVIGTRMMRASETAGRAAKYSVTKRTVPRNKDDE